MRELSGSDRKEERRYGQDWRFIEEEGEGLATLAPDFGERATIFIG